MTCARSSERTKEGKHQDQTVCHQSALKPALTSWLPSSQRSSTDHWSCEKSPHASNASPSSSSQRKPKLLDLMALMSVVMKSFERLVLAYLKVSTGPLLDPLLFAYRANSSVDDAVNMVMHFTYSILSSGQNRDLCEDPVSRLQLRF